MTSLTKTPDIGTSDKWIFFDGHKISPTKVLVVKMHMNCRSAFSKSYRLNFALVCCHTRYFTAPYAFAWTTKLAFPNNSHCWRQCAQHVFVDEKFLFIVAKFNTIISFRSWRASTHRMHTCNSGTAFKEAKHIVKFDSVRLRDRWIQFSERNIVGRESVFVDFYVATIVITSCPKGFKIQCF